MVVDEMAMQAMRGMQAERLPPSAGPIQASRSQLDRPDYI